MCLYSSWQLQAKRRTNIATARWYPQPNAAAQRRRRIGEKPNLKRTADEYRPGIGPAVSQPRMASIGEVRAALSAGRKPPRMPIKAPAISDPINNLGVAANENETS